MANRPPIRARILGIVAVYALAGSLWILFSDVALTVFFTTPEQLRQASILKGWAFMGMTALLLYWLMRRFLQQNAEALWERSQALHLLEAISRNTDDIIFAKDREGRYILCPPAMARFIGQPTERILGRRDIDLFPPTLAEHFKSSDRQVIEERHSHIFEQEMEAPDGRRIYMTTKGPLIDDQGGVVGVFGISRDITPLRKTATELRANEERLRLTLDAVQDGVWDWDLVSGHCYLSPRVYEITGYAPEAICPGVEFHRRLVHPEDWHLVEAAMRAHQRGESHFSELEHRIVTASGAIRWIRGRGRAVTWDGAGNPLRMVGTITDITAQKEGEERLKLWATAFERAGFGLAIGNAVHNTYLMVNPVFARERGYSVEELIGKPIWLAFSPEIMDEAKARIAALEQTGHGVFESEHITRDGRRFPVLLDITVLYGDDGTPRQRVAYALDITERRRAEVALRESEERFRTLFHRSGVAMFIHDAESGAILSANKQALDSFGYGTLEELNRNVWEPPGYGLAEALQWIRRAFVDGPQRFEWKSHDRNGGLLWVEVRLDRINLGGVDRILAIATDITARKLAEEELLRRNAELERFNRAVVGRELVMVELKERINALSRELGREPPYGLDFLAEPPPPGDGV